MEGASQVMGVQERFDIDRGAKSVKCNCGGYAERVECTPDEIIKYDCQLQCGCCSRAFVCCICGDRIVGKAEAPEFDG